MQSLFPCNSVGHITTHTKGISDMGLRPCLSQLKHVYFLINSSFPSAIALLQIDHVVFLFLCHFKINTAEGAAGNASLENKNTFDKVPKFYY